MQAKMEVLRKQNRLEGEPIEVYGIWNVCLYVFVYLIDNKCILILSLPDQYCTVFSAWRLEC